MAVAGLLVSVQRYSPGAVTHMYAPPCSTEFERGALLSCVQDVGVESFVCCFLAFISLCAGAPCLDVGWLLYFLSFLSFTIKVLALLSLSC